MYGVLPPLGFKAILPSHTPLHVKPKISPFGRISEPVPILKSIIVSQPLASVTVTS